MRKRKNRVRFSEQPVETQHERSEMFTVDKIEPEENEHDSRSLLDDASNGTSVTPFNLDDELAEYSIASQVASKAAEDEVKDGDDDDDDDDDENLSRLSGGNISSDEDVQPIEKRRKRNVEEEDSWENEDSEGDPNGPEQDVDQAPKRRRVESSLTEADAVGTIVRLLGEDETVSQALQRLTGSMHETVSEAVKALGSVAESQREELIERIPNWLLCWGYASEGNTHGPFEVGQLNKWARARYFMQRKVGWVRGAGGSRWWRAAEIFRPVSASGIYSNSK